MKNLVRTGTKYVFEILTIFLDFAPVHDHFQISLFVSRKKSEKDTFKTFAIEIQNRNRNLLIN